MTAFLPSFALQDLWAMAKGRGEDPRETASHLILQQLYPHSRDRRRRIRLWRREVWTRGRGVRREMAA